jgi:peptide/nickel transport system substrate-binding protein
MRRRSKLVAGVGLITAAVTLIAACGSSGGGGNNTTSESRVTSAAGGKQGTAAAYNAAFDKVVNPSTKTGGTLKLLSPSDCDSWDPARTYYGFCWNLQRIFTRSLMGYETVNGTQFKPVPDLATAAGQHNSDNTEWTYNLKPGLKFSNGQPIKPIDIKYGVERMFATDVINGGPTGYFIADIAHPKSYKGPYKSGDLSTITTTDTSITFKLQAPDAGFDYLMAMAASAPVPYKTEGGPGFVGATYTKHPMASGPYMIESYTPAKQITFVRNPNWSQSTDTIRHPLSDKITITVDTNQQDIDNQLQAGEADANVDARGVQAAFQSKILTDPNLKKNADDPVSAFTRYDGIIPSVIPNLHCRLAIFYAWDKKAEIQAYGGPTAGEIAGGMTPPGIEGYKAGFNPYPSGPDGKGDVAKAKAELQKCGKPSGFSTNYAYGTPSDQAANTFKLEKTALGRVGIKITAKTSDSSTYYSTFIGSPANLKNQGIGIASAGWGADFPTGVGFFNNIVNGAAILPTGNSNYASLNDPTVNKILDAAPKGGVTEEQWAQLNQAVMASGTYLPIYFGKTLFYRNPRMTNVTCDNALAFGEYDFVNIGVTS